MDDDTTESDCSLTEESESILVDNLLNHDTQDLLSYCTPETKKQILNDSVDAVLIDMIKCLYEEFPDVTFEGKWIPHVYIRSSLRGPNNELLVFEGYDREIDVKGSNCVSGGGWNCGLGEMSFRLAYVWTRTCSLGCQHNHVRFKYISFPRLMEWVADWQLKPPVRQFAKKYLDDFFYDIA